MSWREKSLVAVLVACLAALALVIDGGAIHQGFYEAAAAAIPILLLAVLVHLRTVSNWLDTAETFHREQRRGYKEVLARATEVKDLCVNLVERVEAEEASQEKTIAIQDSLRAAERDLADVEALKSSIGGKDDEKKVRDLVQWILAACLVGAALGEAASLVALAWGHSNTATFIFTVAGLASLAYLFADAEIHAAVWRKGEREYRQFIEESRDLVDRAKRAKSDIADFRATRQLGGS